MADQLDIQAVRQLSDEEILVRIEDNREDMYLLRLQAVTGELKDTNLYKRNRRELARLKTVLAERRLALALSKEEANDGE